MTKTLRPYAPLWAALDSQGEVLQHFYMDERRSHLFSAALPLWVDLVLRTDVHHHTTLARIKQIAIAAGHPGAGIRGGYVGAKAIISEARAIERKADAVAFGRYRKWAHETLANVPGSADVVSGEFHDDGTFMPKVK